MEIEKGGKAYIEWQKNENLNKLKESLKKWSDPLHIFIKAKVKK